MEVDLNGLLGKGPCNLRFIFLQSAQDRESDDGHVKVDGFGEGTSSKQSQSSSEGASPNNAGSNNRNLKSGHARTHAIVINLDDKNRFTEEVTV